MTQQEKFNKILKYKHGRITDYSIQDTWHVYVIVNCNTLVQLLKIDLPEKSIKIIERLAKSKNYNKHLLAIELIYSELLKNNKLP